MLVQELQKQLGDSDLRPGGETMKGACPQCGREVPEVATFCTACGARVRGDEPPIAMPTVQRDFDIVIRRITRGALIGGLAGGSIGLVWIQTSSFSTSKPGVVVVMVLFPAALGALVGGFVGAFGGAISLERGVSSSIIIPFLALIGLVAGFYLGRFVDAIVPGLAICQVAGPVGGMWTGVLLGEKMTRLDQRLKYKVLVNSMRSGLSAAARQLLTLVPRTLPVLLAGALGGFALGAVPGLLRISHFWLDYYYWSNQLPWLARLTWKQITPHAPIGAMIGAALTTAIYLRQHWSSDG